MGGGVDKGKEWQMELLMEKIRSKASQYKTFAETAKSVRMTLLVGYNLIVNLCTPVQEFLAKFMCFYSGKEVPVGQC